MVNLKLIRFPTSLSDKHANSTFLVDKIAPGYSTKLAELALLLDQLLDEDSRKIILPSGRPC